MEGRRADAGRALPSTEDSGAEIDVDVRPTPTRRWTVARIDRWECVEAKRLSTKWTTNAVVTPKRRAREKKDRNA